MRKILNFLFISTLCRGASAFLSSPAVPHFSSVRQPTKPLNAKLPTPEESAQVLTDYMAKAHEDKLRAVAEAETKSKDKIQVGVFTVKV
mmetsp:Transcript_10205/g.14872  ORF Transcript_10205/g.14872 Transcript_10205/m.14872 type:complete len:89 (-) Transcript_10205:818-1084(-)